MTLFPLIIALFLYGMSFTQTAAAPPPSPPVIVTNIKPVHALISGVTEGVTEPVLLVNTATSPHDYSLTPSNAKALAKADIVFFVSKQLEHFLTPSIRALTRTSKTVIELAALAHIRLLPARNTLFWSEEGDGLPSSQQKLTSKDAYDPHLWLNPQNAIVIVQAAEKILSEKDPANQPEYQKNAAHMVKILSDLDRELKDKLAPYADVSYVVFHDAYQYFEKRYHLHSLGAVTAHPEHQPGARSLKHLKEMINKHNAVCLFSEPTSSAKTIELIATETGIGTGILDAEWGITDQDTKEAGTGKNAYFTLMRHLMRNLIGCFDKERSLVS